MSLIARMDFVIVTATAAIALAQRAEVDLDRSTSGQPGHSTELAHGLDPTGVRTEGDAPLLIEVMLR